MVEIVPPDERKCERCGRVDIWDDDEGRWRAKAVDGVCKRGDPHCLHEWNINGEYNPVKKV